MQDLSSIHQPIGSLFEGADNAPSIHLKDKQVQFFEENGYLSGVELLSHDQCDHLLNDLAGLMEPDSVKNPLWHEIHLNESTDPSQVLFHALGAWRISEAFHDLLWNSRFVSIAEQLLRGPIRFWHDQLFCKPAFHGGNVSWHQDYSYWTRTTPMSHLTCWIALEEATLENGCIQYIPGSHHWDLLPITGLAGDMNAIRETLSPTQWKRLQNPIAIELPKGFATFHHPLLVHGSAGNNSARPRRATVINVFRDGVVSNSSEPLLAGVPPIDPGGELAGQFFPLLSTLK